MAKEELLHEGRFLRLKRRGHWEFAERVNARAAVAIVAVTDADELVLVEQPRLPVDSAVIELPAGLVGDIPGAGDEPLVTAATRELEEETGFRAGRMTRLAGGPPSAGLANEQMVFFRADKLRRTSAGGGDASENITPHVVPLVEVPTWLAEQEAAGTMVDPKVYAGLYFVQSASGRRP